MMLFPNFQVKVRGWRKWKEGGEMNMGGVIARAKGFFNAFKIFNTPHKSTLA